MLPRLCSRRMRSPGCKVTVLSNERVYSSRAQRQAGRPQRRTTALILLIMFYQILQRFAFFPVQGGELRLEGRIKAVLPQIGADIVDSRIEQNELFAIRNNQRRLRILELRLGVRVEPVDRLAVGRFIVLDIAERLLSEKRPITRGLLDRGTQPVEPDE